MFAWPIWQANASLAASGTRDSPSPSAQAHWLQYSFQQPGDAYYDGLGQVMSATGPRRLTDLYSARVYVSAQAALSGSVDRANLALLQSSQHAFDRDLAAAYGENPEGWRDAVKYLPQRGILSWIARRHAQRRLNLPVGRAPLYVSRFPWILVRATIRIVGLLLLLTYAALLATRRVRWLGHPAEVGNWAGALGIVWRANILRSAHVLAGFAPYGVWLLLPALARSSLYDVWWRVAYSCPLLVLSLIAAAIPLGRIRLAVLGPHRGVRGILNLGAWGLGGFFAAMTAVFASVQLQTPLSTVFPHLPGPAARIDVPFDWIRATAGLVSACIVAPICEELAFRGALLPALSSLVQRRWVSVAFAILVSSLIFAAGHGYGVPAWPATMALGAVQCVLVYQTRSLLPAMICHALYNGWVNFGHIATLQAAFPSS